MPNKDGKGPKGKGMQDGHGDGKSPKNQGQRDGCCGVKGKDKEQVMPAGMKKGGKKGGC